MSKKTKHVNVIVVSRRVILSSASCNKHATKRSNKTRALPSFRQHLKSCRRLKITRHYLMQLHLPRRLFNFCTGIADWRRQPGRPRIMWLSTVQQDLKQHAPRSSRFGSEPPSVEDDVDVWCYAILELHARNDNDEWTRISAGESMSAQEWTHPHGQCGRVPGQLRVSRCWHWTDNGTTEWQHSLCGHKN